MSGPDFLIIGAMKCGTSTLAAQLGAQDGLFMTTPKEPNFFSDDDVFAKGPDWYQALFDAAAPDDVRGEASTHYTKLPTYPHTLDRLTQMVAAPRLVYLIRDPIHRAVSHYIHEWTMGVMSGDIDAAFDTYSELVDYGRYGYQIQPWIDRFGAEAICLVSLEEMQRDPAGVLTRVGAHIGAPEGLVWKDDLAQVNVSSERFRRLPMQKLLIENPAAKALRRTLVPKALRQKIRAGRQMTTRPTLSEARRADLAEVFAQDRADLAKAFPGAAALTDSYPFLAS